MNGKGDKEPKTSKASFEIMTPLDRTSSFFSWIVSKRERILAEILEKKIIRLYGEESILNR